MFLEKELPTLTFKWYLNLHGTCWKLFGLCLCFTAVSILVHFSSPNIQMKSSFTLLESELMEHTKTLVFFKNLPTDLRKYVQTFHQSRRPVLAYHQCDKHYYQVSCFHKWLPCCRYHNSFPIFEEGLFYLEDR